MDRLARIASSLNWVTMIDCACGQFLGSAVVANGGQFFGAVIFGHNLHFQNVTIGKEIEPLQQAEQKRNGKKKSSPCRHLAVSIVANANYLAVVSNIGRQATLLHGSW